MLEYLRLQMWFSFSMSLNLPIADCKKVILEAVKRIESGKAEPNDFTPKILECIDFYIDTRQYLYSKNIE